MAAKVVWESIGEFTHRMKVPGGWLVKVHHTVQGTELMQAAEVVAMCFVPDPRHDWNTGTDTK